MSILIKADKKEGGVIVDAVLSKHRNTNVSPPVLFRVEVASHDHRSTHILFRMQWSDQHSAQAKFYAIAKALELEIRE